MPVVNSKVTPLWTVNTITLKITEANESLCEVNGG